MAPMIATLPDRANTAAIVVTYNPGPHTLHCIATVIEHFDRVVVVDNNSTSTAFGELLQRLEAEPRGWVIRNPSNRGIAVGLNVGIEHAARHGYSWFYLLDQDTEITSSPQVAMRQIIAAHAAANPGRPLGLIGSAYFHDTDNSAAASVPPEVTQPGQYTHEPAVITAGTLLPLSTYTQLGPFREDYFIDHVDHEYCLRARQRGLDVIKSAVRLTRHRLGNFKEYRGFLSFYKPRASSNYSPIRRYYAARNLILLRREYAHHFPDFLKKLTRDWVRDLIRVLKYEDRKWAKLRMAAQGLFDGLTSKTAT